MSEFWIYLQIGLSHVLDINSYDHVLFLVALAVPFTFKDWKELLVLVTIFTIGHTVALLLAVYNIVIIKASIAEFLIPITIIITGLYSIFTAGKTQKADSSSPVLFITLFFGIIHGLGFANYFKSILTGNTSDKLLPLFEFAFGIECAQVIVVLTVLVLAYIVQTFFRFSKRDWALVMSAFVVGVVLPMIISSKI